MAKFHKGQRVKYVNTILNPHVPTGAEGTVIGPVYLGYAVDFAPHSHGKGTDWEVFSKSIVPLTPPAQDEWADAKVKQVTKPVYTEPERVKERAHG